MEGGAVAEVVAEAAEGVVDVRVDSRIDHPELHR